ncbi:MAG: hypothetical protein WDN49_14295 [Acetobacteraceae bacterium]
MDLVEFFHVVDRKRQHANALAAAHRDEPLGLQPQQGFPHRGAADAQFLRRLDLVYCGIGRDVAALDPLLQCAVGCIGGAR